MRQRTKTSRTGALQAAGVAVLLAFSSPLFAQDVPETMQGEHVVRQGETLWDLSRRYLQNPFLWGLIYKANEGTVENPHLIYPDDRLRIPGLVAREAPTDPEATEVAEVAAPPARTRFYVGTPSAAEEEEEPELGPMIEPDEDRESSAVRIEEFYSAPWLAERSALPIIGELITVVGRETTMKRLPRSAFPYDRVFLRYRGDRAPELDERLLLVREGSSIRRMGRVIRPTGIVRVTALEDEVIEAVVEEQFDRVLTGDRALVMERFPGPIGAAERAVEAGPEGRIVGFYDDPALAKDYGLGFIDLGEDDGVAVGDELIAFLPERKAGGGYSERLPAEPVARLRVVRVDERSATVKVMHMDLPSLESGMAVRLVATAS